jgi:hypothetical protein
LLVSLNAAYSLSTKEVMLTLLHRQLTTYKKQTDHKMEGQLVTAKKGMCRISHPFPANVLGHLPAGNRPYHGADVGQRAERRELQRAIHIVRHEEPQDPEGSKHSRQVNTAGTHLGDGEPEVPDHGVLGGGGEAAGEAELDGAERDDERAEEGGDVGLAQDGHGGSPGSDAGLPRAHPVPAARVDDQQRLPHPAVVVAAALLPGAASAPVAGATHAVARQALPSPRA